MKTGGKLYQQVLKYKKIWSNLLLYRCWDLEHLGLGRFNNFTVS